MYYENIFKTLAKFRVKYLIAGGMAVNLHGIPRFTKDLDIIIDHSDRNLARLVKALKTAGYRPKIPVTLESFLDRRNWKKWKREKGMVAFALFHLKNPHEQIDLLIHIPLTYAKARRKQVRVQAGKLRLNLVGIDDLIRLKEIAGREQDLSDIAALKTVKKLRRQRKR